MDQKNLSENHLIFQRSRHVARYPAPFVFLSVSWRADSPANSVHWVIPHRQMCQNCKCVRSVETRREAATAAR